VVTGGLGRVREAFLAAGYTVDGVADRLGPLAGTALQRHETVPARRATSGGDALDLLLRLFPLQLAVEEGAANAVLPVADLIAAGLVERSAGELRALLDVRPYSEAVVGRSGQPDGSITCQLNMASASSRLGCPTGRSNLDSIVTPKRQPTQYRSTRSIKNR